MLNLEDKKLLDLLREKLHLCVVVSYDYGPRLEVTLHYEDIEGKRHIVTSDSCDLPSLPKNDYY